MPSVIEYCIEFIVGQNTFLLGLMPFPGHSFQWASGYFSRFTSADSTIQGTLPLSPKLNNVIQNFPHAKYNVHSHYGDAPQQWIKITYVH